MHVLGVALLGMTFLVAGCGSRDASGIYVVISDNEVTLVQLVEDKDHKLSGRIEVNTIGPDATVTGKTASLDGSVSGNELILRPASIWLGGIQASGIYSSSSLQLTGQGFNISAERSSLDGYQVALSKLKSVAEGRQAKLAQADAQLKHEEARMQGERDTAANVASIREAASRIANATSRLNEGISKSPDYAKFASANTARISRMLAAAPNMSEAQRRELGVQANQIMAGTNQIEVSRSLYSIQLNAVVDDAKVATAPIASLCGRTPKPQFASVCSEAFTAMNGFKAAVERGKSSFSPYERQIADEMREQEQLAAKIDG